MTISALILPFAKDEDLRRIGKPDLGLTDLTVQTKRQKAHSHPNQFVDSFIQPSLILRDLMVTLKFADLRKSAKVSLDFLFVPFFSRALLF